MSSEKVHNFNLGAWELPVAAASVILAVLSTCFQVYRHTNNYSTPKLQKHIIRIILMVPIYAINSLISLFYKPAGVYIDLIRDAYEAFVLYQFMCLLVEYCGGERELVRVLHCRMKRSHHLFPFCCLGFKVNKGFLLTCKRGTLQYGLIKPLNALIALLASFGNAYVEGNWDFKRDTYPYICIINNVSITFSMYYLVLFGHVLEEELRVHKPFLKFICIKTIIFLSFWQGVALSAAMKLQLVRGTDTVPAAHISTAIQDFAICCEMCLISLVHHFSFGYDQMAKECNQSNYGKTLFTENAVLERSGRSGKSHFKVITNLTDSIDVRDCIVDTKRTFGRNKEGLLEEDDNYVQCFENQLGKEKDARTGLDIISVPESEMKHFGEWCRSGREEIVLHYFGRCKRMTHKGRQKPVVLLITDKAVAVTTAHGEGKRFIKVAELLEVVCASDLLQIGLRTTQAYDLLLLVQNSDVVTEVVRILSVLHTYLVGSPLRTNMFWDPAKTHLKLDKPDLVIRSEADTQWTGLIDQATGLRIMSVPEADRRFFGELCDDESGVTLFFLQHVKRLTSKGGTTNRVLALSNTAIYVYTTTGQQKRCIPMPALEEVIIGLAPHSVAFRMSAQSRECDLHVQFKAALHVTEVLNICTAWTCAYRAGQQITITDASRARVSPLNLKNSEPAPGAAPVSPSLPAPVSAATPEAGDQVVEIPDQEPKA